MYLVLDFQSLHKNLLHNSQENHDNVFDIFCFDLECQLMHVSYMWFVSLCTANNKINYN